MRTRLIRVIPRDLFNEANLLKCMGHLWIALDYVGPRSRFKFGVEHVVRFTIEQDPADGSIYVASIPVFLGERRAHLYRPLNSRQPWPLYLSIPGDPDFETIAVFDDEGMLSQEFSDLIMGGTSG